MQNQRILLCRISNHLPEDAGYWTLPGGGIDFGEDPVNAMLREVYEETGLVVRALGLAGIDSFHKETEADAFHAVRILYQAELVSGNLTNELDGTTDLCAWWSYEEAKQLQLVDLAEVGLGLAFSKT